MNNNQKKLIGRGYVGVENELEYTNLTINEKIDSLKSENPTKRTIGARLLAQKYTSTKQERIIENLIEQLKVEKKLYPKIEISNSIVSYNTLSIKPLIAVIGNIGKNQHKTIPEKEFRKKSYPLPRDIASRTIIRIGKNALPELLKALKTKNENQTSEIIDAIGYICYYDHQTIVYEKLKEYFLKSENDLIKWKLSRAFSGFQESQFFLQEQKKQITNKRIIKEIERSLLLIKENNKN